MKIVQKWSKKLIGLKDTMNIEQKLIEPIEFTSNLLQLADRLPNSQYDNEEGKTYIEINSNKRMQKMGTDSNIRNNSSLPNEDYKSIPVIENEQFKGRNHSFFSIKRTTKSNEPKIERQFNKYILDTADKYPIVKLMKKQILEDCYMNNLEDPRNPMIEAITELPKIYDGKKSIRKAVEKGKKRIEEILRNHREPKTNLKSYPVTLLEELTYKPAAPFKMKGSLSKDLRKPIQKLPHYEGELLADINRIRSNYPIWTGQ